MELAAELPCTVKQYDGDSGSVRFKARQHVLFIRWAALTGILLDWRRSQA